MLLDQADLPGDVGAGLALQPVLKQALELGDSRDEPVGEPEAGGKVGLALAEPLGGLGNCSYDYSPLCYWQGTVLRA